MTIAFQELAGWPREEFGPDGARAQRRVLVAWDDRHAMMRELLGEGYTFGSSSAASYPGIPDVVAMRARIEPFSQVPDGGEFSRIDLDINTYGERPAVVTIDYELLEPTTDDLPECESGTILKYSVDHGLETIPLGGASSTLSWESDSTIPVSPDTDPVLRVPILEHHLSWRRVLNPPWAAIRTTIGRVNIAAFLSAAAETLLLDGCRASREFIGLDSLTRPQLCWRLDYIFRERLIQTPAGAVGWRHAWRALPQGTAGFDRLKVGANHLVQSADFSTLLQFAAS